MRLRTLGWRVLLALAGLGFSALTAQIPSAGGAGGFLPAWLEPLVTLAMYLAVAGLVIPVLIPLCWRLRELKHEPTRKIIDEELAANGVSVARVLNWPATMGGIATAGVFGLLPRFRYLLFSHSLTAALTPDEIRSITAHEATHLRQRHLWYFMAAILAYILCIHVALQALALAGLPPLSGFWSKDEILQAVWQDQNPVVLVFTLGAALLSALYMARLCFIVFFGPLKPENADVHESPAIFLMPLAALGALTLVIGFTAPDWLDNVLRLPAPYTGFTSFLIGAPDQFHRHVALAATGSLIALAGIGAGWAIYHRKLVSSEAIAQRLATVHRLLVNKYYLDDLYQAVIDRVVLVFSELVARFDRTIVNDAGVDGSGRFVTVASRILRLHETGQISNYILAIVLGSVIFILAITLSA